MAIVNDKLISQYSYLHAAKNYGSTGHYFWPHIQACIVDIKPSRILEYGCGQSNLVDVLEYKNAEYHRYDPAIPELSGITTSQVDLIINTDVLEHIPEDNLDDVLRHMKSLSSNVFFNISTCLAKHILPNGENAHCTVWKAEKWLAKIQQFFPEAVLCFADNEKVCLIVTWDSPVTKLINQIEIYRQIFIDEKVGLFKAIERKIRKIRNSIIGKERFRALKRKIKL